MITEVILPKLGQTMEEGSVVEWVKKEGDPIKRGDLLFTVESDKAVLDVEATARGFLRKILVPEGQVVPVLTPVALITRAADEDISSYGTAAAEAAAAETAVEEPADEIAAPATTAAATGPVRSAGRIFASPRARKTARAQDVDLALVTGTGPNGRIVEQDVLDHVASRPKATPVAAKTAGALGVDLAAVAGTGPGGRITKADVEAAAQPPAPAVETPVTVPASLPALAPVERGIQQVPMAGPAGHHRPAHGGQRRQQRPA